MRFCTGVGALASSSSPDGLRLQQCVVAIYRLRMMLRHAIRDRVQGVPVPQKYAEMQVVLNAVDVSAHKKLAEQGRMASVCSSSNLPAPSTPE